jgi:hypothetical protein
MNKNNNGRFSKNGKTLEQFTNYCEAHPELRFWQALKIWADADFILAVKYNTGITLTQCWDQDTYYREGRDV